MKKVLIISLIMIVSLTLSASEKIVGSKIKSVKVFIRGAELVHQAQFDLEDGNNTIVVGGMAAGIDINSLNVKGIGDFIILETKLSQNYLSEKEKTREITILEDSLKSLEYEIEVLNSDISVLLTEVELIIANKYLGSETKAPSVDEIKKMQKFFKSELTALKRNVVNFQFRVQEKEKVKQLIKKQLDELLAGAREVSDEVIISLYCKNPGKAEIEITYFTFEAGWKASYDLRVSEINSPLNLIQKGIIWQGTGLDWENKNIVLSTGNPSYGGYIPVLSSWYLNFYQEKLFRGGAENKMEKLAAAPMVESVADGLYEYVEIKENQLSAEYVTEIKYNIPSDRNEHVVQLKSSIVEAEYTYYSAPKLTGDVFLTAVVKDWQGNLLMGGKANIFFENSYVGSTYLNINNVEEEMKISLGRDPNVSVKREQVKDYTEERFLSSNVDRRYNYKYTVKNNKKASIRILLEDNYPISKHEDIEVQLLDIDGAENDAESGKVRWSIDLEGGEMREKTLSFKVKYPGDKIIEGL